MGLDSFILFNEETLDEQVTLTELTADRKEEEHNAERLEQFAAFDDISKPSKGLELQLMCHFILNLDTKENDSQINANPGESKHIQLSTDTQ